MKKNINTTLSLLVLSFIIFSCNNDTEKPEEETGTKISLSTNDTEGKQGSFSFDGKEVNGETEIQYFGDKEKGNFSVLCQHNEGDAMNPDFELLQVTFLTEKEANEGVNLKIYDGGSILPMTEPEPGIVTVSLKGNGKGFSNEEFTGTEKSTGTIEVKNKTVILKDIVLFTRSGDKRVVNANLPY